MMKKILMGLWILIPAIIIGMSVYGWSIGDMAGGVLISFLPVSLLSSIAVVVSSVVENPVSRFSKWVWLTVCCAAFIAAIHFAYRPSPDAIRGADMLLAYAMLILAFPTSLLMPLILMLVSPYLERIGSSIIGLFIMWAVFAISGYLQWFVLLPWVQSKWRNLRSRS
jgi:hypothetical protein